MFEKTKIFSNVFVEIVDENFATKFGKVYFAPCEMKQRSIQLKSVSQLIPKVDQGQSGRLIAMLVQQNDSKLYEKVRYSVHVFFNSPSVVSPSAEPDTFRLIDRLRIFIF